MEYDYIYSSMEGWLAYAKTANSYNLRTEFIEAFESYFSDNIADVEINRWLKAEA